MRRPPGARFGAALLSVTMLGVGLCATPVSADAVADFYRGKQIRVIVRTLPATDYDAYSRLLARFMGKYIPGNPTMVVVNMTGGGGIIAANYMAEVAPRDGTVIGIVSQGLAADQALGQSPQLKANLREFNWIANVVFSNQLLVTWHTSATKTLEQAKQRVSTIGTTGAGSASVQYPLFYNSVIGTRFKIITGYRSGAEIDLAMERGEVEGRGTNPYSSFMTTHPTWIPQNKIIPLVQAGVEKEPDLPNVPLILDLPVRAQDRAVARVHGARVDRRPAAGDDAGRSRRPGGGAAPRIRRGDPRPGVHRGGGEREARGAPAIRRQDRGDHFRIARHAGRRARADEGRAGVKGFARDRTAGSTEQIGLEQR